MTGDQWRINPIDPFQKDFFSPSLVCCVEDLHEDGGDDDDVGVKASFHMETVKEYITFSGRDVQRLCGTAYENKSAQFRWEAVKLLTCVLIWLQTYQARWGEERLQQAVFWGELTHVPTMKV